MADRAKMYKNKDRDHDEMRRRRMDTSVELRKVKKDENMQKRRNINFEDFAVPSEVGGEVAKGIMDGKATVSGDGVVAPERVLSDITGKVGEAMSAEKAVEAIRSRTSYEETLRAAEHVRRELSKSQHAPLDLYVKLGLIPAVVPLMRKDVPKDLMFEVAWILTNIASGNTEQTLAVAKSGALVYLVEFMKHEDKRIVEQANWAITNIMGESGALRENILQHDFLTGFFHAFDKYCGDEEVVKNCAWTISNICRHKEPQLSIDTFKQVVPYLKRIFGMKNNVDAIIDATWALTYASEGNDATIDVILQGNLLPFIVRNLSGSSDKLISPSLRIVGNIATGTDVQTERLLQEGFLQVTPSLLNKSKGNIQKETCWVLSNIAAGTSAQIQQIIDMNLVQQVLHLLAHGDTKTQKECMWVLSNMCQSGTAPQKEYLVGLDVIGAVVPKLRASSMSEVSNALEVVHSLLAYLQPNAVAFEHQCVAFEVAGGLELVEELQEHEQEDIYNKAFALLDQFFNQENEDTDVQRGGASMEAQDGAAGGAEERFNF